MLNLANAIAAEILEEAGFIVKKPIKRYRSRQYPYYTFNHSKSVFDFELTADLFPDFAYDINLKMTSNLNGIHLDRTYDISKPGEPDRLIIDTNALIKEPCCTINHRAVRLLGKSVTICYDGTSVAEPYLQITPEHFYAGYDTMHHEMYVHVFKPSVVFETFNRGKIKSMKRKFMDKPAIRSFQLWDDFVDYVKEVRRGWHP